MKKTLVKVTSFLSCLFVSCSQSGSGKSQKTSGVFQAENAEAITLDKVSYHVTNIKNFDKPFDAIRDPQGNLIVVEFTLKKILKFNPSHQFTQWIGALSSGGFATSWSNPEEYTTDPVSATEYSRPHSLGIHPTQMGKLLVTYYGDEGASFSNNISMYDLGSGNYDGSFGLTGLGIFSQGYTTDTKLSQGDGIFLGLVNNTYDSTENFFVSDYKANTIIKFNKSYAYQGYLTLDGWKKTGTPTASREVGAFDRPHNIAFDSSGNFYVADTWNHRVQKFSASGNFLGWLGQKENGPVTSGWETVGKAVLSANPGAFNAPIIVRVDAHDNLYVLEYDGGRLQKFTKDGKYIDQLTGFNKAYGFFFSENEIIITDTGNQRVMIYTKDN